MSGDPRAVLAAFIRNQASLVTLPGGKVVQGVGDVRLNNAEALLAAEALERASSDRALTLAEVKRAHVLFVFDACDRDKVRTADALGISLKALYNYLHRWGQM